MSPLANGRPLELRVFPKSIKLREQKHFLKRETQAKQPPFFKKAIVQKTSINTS